MSVKYESHKVNVEILFVTHLLWGKNSTTSNSNSNWVPPSFSPTTNFSYIYNFCLLCI